MTVYCSKCSATNEDFAEFCVSCGEYIAKEEDKEQLSNTTDSSEEKKTSKLYRSRTDRIISGLSAGLAKEFNMDVDLVRILWVIAFFITGGVAFIAYLILMIIIPLEPLPASVESEKS